MKYLILLSLFTMGCSFERPKSNNTSTSKYVFNCESIGNDFKRCENNEAVCYSSNYTGSVVTPNCKFK